MMTNEKWKMTNDKYPVATARRCGNSAQFLSQNAEAQECLADDNLIAVFYRIAIAGR